MNRINIYDEYLCNYQKKKIKKYFKKAYFPESKYTIL